MNRTDQSRGLALLLAVLMAVSLLGGSAWAADVPQTAAEGSSATYTKTYTPKKSGSYCFQVKFQDGMDYTLQVENAKGQDLEALNLGDAQADDTSYQVVAELTAGESYTVRIQDWNQPDQPKGYTYQVDRVQAEPDGSECYLKSYTPKESGGYRFRITFPAKRTYDLVVQKQNGQNVTGNYENPSENASSDTYAMAEVYLTAGQTYRICILDGNESLAPKGYTYQAVKKLPQSGTVHGIRWSYDDSSQTLSFSGTGALTKSLRQAWEEGWPWDYLCGAVQTITVGEGITELGPMAADNFQRLTTVTLPSSIRKLDAEAFEGAIRLENLSNLDRVTYFGANVFNGTRWGKLHTNAKQLMCYHQWLLGCNTEKIGTKITIPSSVKKIADSALYGAQLKQVTIPDSVTAIGSQALSDNQFTSVRVGKHVTKLGDYAFEGCEQLTNVTLPAGLKTIGAGAFQNCWQLKKVTVPKSVTAIGKQAFGYRDYAQSKTRVSAWEKTCSSCQYDRDEEMWSYFWDQSVAWTGFQVIGTAGSAAQRYAQQNHMKFQKENALARPKLTAARNSAKGVVLQWNKVAQAEGYIIYRKAGTGNWSKLATQKGNSTLRYTDGKAANGTVYTYGVRAYAGKKTSGMDAAGKTVLRLTAPQCTGVKPAGHKKLTVTWSKNAKAAGYQIQYATAGSFRQAKTITVSSGKTVQKTLDGLKGTQTYFVRVRAYGTVSRTQYVSAWSDSKEAAMV